MKREEIADLMAFVVVAEERSFMDLPLYFQTSVIT